MNHSATIAKSAKLIRQTRDRVDDTHTVNVELRQSLTTSFARLEQSRSMILRSEEAIEELAILRGGKEMDAPRP